MKLNFMLEKKKLQIWLLRIKMNVMILKHWFSGRHEDTLI